MESKHTNKNLFFSFVFAQVMGLSSSQVIEAKILNFFWGSYYTTAFIWILTKFYPFIHNPTVNGLLGP